MTQPVFLPYPIQTDNPVEELTILIDRYLVPWADITIFLWSKSISVLSIYASYDRKRSVSAKSETMSLSFNFKEWFCSLVRSINGNEYLGGLGSIGTFRLPSDFSLATLLTNHLCKGLTIPTQAGVLEMKCLRKAIKNNALLNLFRRRQR